MDDLLARAVRNNAEWCARICGLHGSPGRLAYAAWATPAPAPRYYPNIVTLRPDCVTAQLTLIQQMGRLGEGWGVKDSFANLDLAPLGFRAAIQGRWLRHADSPADDGGVEWRDVGTRLDLVAWEAAWGGDGHRGHPRIFLPGILGDETITIFSGYVGGRLEAGGIVNRAAGVAGLSNIFASSPELARTVVAHALDLAGDAPLVGWGADGEMPEAEPLGPLRVWLRDYSGGPSS